MFAKHDFETAFGVVQHVPYGDLRRRAVWLFTSFASRYFFRFVVVLMIETMTALSVTRAMIRATDKYRLLREWKWREPVFSVLAFSLVFVMFGNIVRFEWAYSHAGHAQTNVVMLAWLGITSIVFANTYFVHGQA
jgi:hypothetical protein